MLVPVTIVIKAAEEFKDKTTAPNQLWRTDFTHLKVTGWGWYYLSTVLDDFSRFIVAWKLCATMKALDVTATLDLALAASGLDQMTVVHRPRASLIVVSLNVKSSTSLASGSLATVSWYLIERTRFSEISAFRRSPTKRCGSCLRLIAVASVSS